MLIILKKILSNKNSFFERYKLNGGKMKKTLFSILSIGYIASFSANAEQCPDYMTVSNAIREHAKLEAELAIKLGNQIAPEEMSASNASFSVDLNTKVDQQETPNSLDCTYKIGDETFYSVTFTKTEK